MASVAFQDTLVVQRGSFPPGPIFKQSWVCVVCVVCPLECVLALVYSILQTIPKNPKHLQYQKKNTIPKKKSETTQIKSTMAMCMCISGCLKCVFFHLHIILTVADTC